MLLPSPLGGVQSKHPQFCSAKAERQVGSVQDSHEAETLPELRFGSKAQL